jgi:hypothetical protein
MESKIEKVSEVVIQSKVAIQNELAQQEKDKIFINETEDINRFDMSSLRNSMNNEFKTPNFLINIYQNDYDALKVKFNKKGESHNYPSFEFDSFVQLKK